MLLAAAAVFGDIVEPVRPNSHVQRFQHVSTSSEWCDHCGRWFTAGLLLSVGWLRQMSRHCQPQLLRRTLEVSCAERIVSFQNRLWRRSAQLWTVQCIKSSVSFRAMHAAFVYSAGSRSPLRCSIHNCALNCDSVEYFRLSSGNTLLFSERSCW